MTHPNDALDALAASEADLASVDHDPANTGVDRRQFLFYSLVTAAAGAVPAPGEPH